MPKALILGYKGTLGQELVKKFSQKEFELVAWDKEEADITSPDIKSKVSDLRPSIIINATGYNAVDKAELDPVEKELCFKINAIAPKILAEVAKEIDAIFVNYSSDYIFKGDKEEGYNENDIPNPISVYGESKYLGEKNIQSTGGKYYIIRPSRIFGKPGVSAMSKKSFVDIMLSKKDDAQIKVVNEENGSPTFAPDLADFTYNLIAKDKPSGIYHGANTGACTWYEWAKEIFNIIGADKIEVIPALRSDFPVPARRPQFSELINNKMPPQPSWQDALKRYLENEKTAL